MKLHTHPPSSTAMNEMADTGQLLLQAVRNMQQPEPSPALDAAILSAAAERAAEVREARTSAAAVVTETPAAIHNALGIPKPRKAHSALERFSRWLLGGGGTRGHIWQAAAASVFIGVALGLMMQANQENVPSPGSSKNEIAMLTHPASEAELSVEAAEKMQESAVAFVEKDEAVMRMAAKPAILESEAARGRSAASSVPHPAPALSASDSLELEARAVTSVMENSAAPAASPPASRKASSEEVSRASQRARGLASPPLASAQEEREDLAPSIAGSKSAATPLPEAASSYEERSAQDMAAGRKMNSEASPKAASEVEIDTQLKRIIELRRDKKEEEAEILLRQLRVRYPGVDIDERLRQREKGESK